MFDRTEVYGALQAYLKKQIQPLFEYFRTITNNWTKIPTGHTDQYNQINAIGTACSVGVVGCRELIKSWYRQWMENPHHNPIHPNLKGTVYCHAIAIGGVEEWDLLGKCSRTPLLHLKLPGSGQPWLAPRHPGF